MGYDTSGSEIAYQRAEQVIAGGVNSGARGPDAGWVPSPPVIARGEGPELWDVDGNRYVDHLLALGPMIHGHAHPEMTEAVTAAIRELSTMYALPYELEAEAARAIVDAVPSVDLVRFSNSGTEAVLHATRIARAATGRTLVVRFEGQYHGWADQLEWSHHPDLADAGHVLRPNALPASLGIPKAFGSALVVMPWNDAEAIEGYMSEHGDEVAAILTEPVMGNTGVIPPNPGYLELLRDLSTRHGSVLIFDEVITGFRVALGGAQAKYGVTPDLPRGGLGPELSAVRDPRARAAGPRRHGAPEQYRAVVRVDRAHRCARRSSAGCVRRRGLRDPGDPGRHRGRLREGDDDGAGT